MPSPTLSSVMSTFPVRVEADTTVAVALELLEENGFNHLPVSRDAEVVGMVSKRMLKVAQVAGRADLPLAELCGESPATFEIGTPLREVAHQMGELSASAAVVLARGRVAGIVTSSDLCEVLVALLPGPPPPSTPSDVA